MDLRSNIYMLLAESGRELPDRLGGQSDPAASGIRVTGVTVVGRQDPQMGAPAVPDRAAALGPLMYRPARRGTAPDA